MANNNPQEEITDDFMQQILAIPSSYTSNEAANEVAVLQLGGSSRDGGGFQAAVFPLGLSLEQSSFVKQKETSGSGKRFPDDLGEARDASVKIHMQEREAVHLTGLLTPFEHIQTHSLRPNTNNTTPQASTVAVPHPPAIRPRVRARRGQATDPHSIAERLRRERIAERMKALQELVPNSSKTDRAAMLDEIVDYVKFLRLQVKVLGMSRLGGAGAVAQLVAEIPLPSVEGEGSSDQPRAWEKWSTDGTERQVAKLMEEDVGAAMQFLQSKSLCVMPISLATAIYHSHQSDAPTFIKPEPIAHS